MEPVKTAILIIGDEILSGRTRDINVQQIASFLAPLGLSVGEVRIVADEADQIIDALNTLRSRYSYVFSTGGIGPTHDDITAECVAAAFDVALTIRDDARVILEDWYARSNTEVTPARLRMARIPDGAHLIANPVTGAPGFQLDNVFVMAGVPKIVRAMLEDIADRLEGGGVSQAISVRLDGVREGDIAEALGETALNYPDLSLGSYPWFEENEAGELMRGVVLVARGTDEARLKAVETELKGFSRFLKV